MRRKQKIGRAFEKKWSRKTKSKITIGSGNLWFDKEDVKNSNWLFQNKATTKDKYALKLNDIKKLKNNAKKTSRKCGLAIEFKSGNVFNQQVFVLVPVEYLKRKKDVKPKLFMYAQVVGKQVKLVQTELSANWVNERIPMIKFVDYDTMFAVLHELDFLGYFQKDFE